MSSKLLVWFVGLAVVAAGAFELYRRTGSPPAPPNDITLEGGTPPLTLDAQQKAYLWQIEHHGNLLARHGFKPLADALQKGDAAALQRLLAPDFAGEALAQPQETALHSEVLDVVRHSDAGGDRVRLTADQFVARLLELRKVFPPTTAEADAVLGGQAQGPENVANLVLPFLKEKEKKEVKVKLSLMGLSPTTWGDLDSPWRGKALLRLSGEWEDGRPAEVLAYLEYRLPRPTTERLAVGGWLSACSLVQSQVGKARHKLMQESAARRGIDPKQFHDNWFHDTITTHTGGVFVCDFNRDGYLDLMITDLGHCFLYQGGPGGKFTDVTTTMGLSRSPPTGSDVHLVAAFADLDGDGWEDLILGSKVYRNDHGRRFVDLGEQCNLHIPSDTSGIAIADYDRDGRVDLYATRGGPPEAGSWLNGKSGPTARNYLFRNKGNWQFEDVTYLTGTDGDQPSAFTAIWLDADDDGWPDLYVINEFGDGILYRNLGRAADGSVRFEPRRLTDHPCDFGSMGGAAGDVDNDGRIDIYAANMYSKAGNRVIGNLKPGTYPERIMAKMRRFVTGSQLHRNLGGLRFEQVGEAWQVNDCGWAYGPALADLDNDGWLDLHATCGFISRSRGDPDG